MDIAAASMQMSMTQTQVNAGFAIANKIMDTTEAQAAGLLEMLTQTMPSFGFKIDFRV